MLAVVESGKANTKFKGNAILNKFSTKYTVGEKVIEGVDTNTYNISYNGVLYKVGDCGGENDFEVSKNKDIHKISIITALSILKPVGFTDYKLVTGTPVNLFFTDERDKIKENLLGHYDVTLYKNKKESELSFNIAKVLVAPETMGYIYNNYGYCKNHLVKVVDIGGLNTNGLVYKDGKPISGTGFTNNQGINILISSIMKSLNKDGYNYQRYEVEYFLRNGTENSREREIIEARISEHITNLERELRANSWNIDSGEIVFTGGGALLLSDYLKIHFKNAVISADCIYDNTKGFYKLGEALL